MDVRSKDDWTVGAAVRLSCASRCALQVVAGEHICAAPPAPHCLYWTHWSVRR